MSESTTPIQAPPAGQPWQPPPKPRHRTWRVIAIVVGGLVLLLAGIGIGSSGKTHTVTVTKTHTIIKTVQVPGPTVTKTVHVPGPTVTKTAGPPPPSATMPGDGTFTVGTAQGDWAPGTWQSAAPASGNCYWATLSDLSGSDGSILANNNSAGPSVLQVGSGVAGVQVSGCSTWNKVG